MKVGLTVLERMAVLSTLPKEGSFITLKVLREMIQRVGFTAEELKKFEIKEKEGKAEWNIKGNDPVEFEFSDIELDIIRKQFKKLDSENKLVQEMFSTYEKFCT
jgi:hypothetical protein